MTIRAKLSFLTVLVLLSVFTIGSAFLITIQRLDEIGREQKSLLNLSLSLNYYATVVNSLDSNQIDGVYARFEEARDKLGEAFGQVEKIRRITSTDDSLKKSVQTILNLRASVEETEQEIERTFGIVREDVKTYFYETQSTQILLFYTNDYARNKYDFTQVYTHLDNFFTAVLGTNGTMESINRTVEEQGELIDRRIQKQTETAVLIFIIATVLLLIVIFFYTGIIAGSIHRRVLFVDRSLRPLGEGDLTEMIVDGKKDEISAISRSINGIMINLSGLIRHTKDQVNQLRLSGSELSSFMEQASASLTKINDSVTRSGNHLNEQTEAVGKTSRSGELLRENSRLLEQAFQRQTGVIEESSSAVEELIANITTLTGTADKVGAAADDLLLFSETGKGKMDNVAESVVNINESSENLINASSLITNIAARTNLLAMNASIEAAHAGEAGRGFAVVAGEIRSLANRSSEQAERVTRDLKNTRDALVRISDLTGDTQQVFHSMIEKFRNVQNLIVGLKSAIGEQNSGNSELLAGIGELRTIGADVKEAVERSAEASGLITEAIELLEETNSLVITNNVEIIRDTEDMGRSVGTINDMAGRNLVLINALEKETARFRITEDRDRADIPV